MFAYLEEARQSLACREEVVQRSLVVLLLDPRTVVAAEACSVPQPRTNS